jgi:hypothetical protein
MEPYKEADLACLTSLCEVMEQSRELENMKEDQVSEMKRDNMMVAFLYVWVVFWGGLTVWHSMRHSGGAREDKKEENTRKTGAKAD